jgi:hypothetical protein
VRALESWLPKTKGRISSAVLPVGTDRTFGVEAGAAAALGTRDAAIIFIPGPSSGK